MADIRAVSQISAAIFALFCTQAQAVTSKEFLKYSEGKKHFYYQGFFDAIGGISALRQAENAQCVWGWLADNPKERKKLLDESFKAHPEREANAVIFFIVQRDCGPIMPLQPAEN